MSLCQWNSRGFRQNSERLQQSICLLMLLLVLAFHSMTLSGAGEAVRICILDTLVAIISGLIIFPACFSYGVETSAGPPLIFITLPQVFIHMAGGRIWGTIFFLFMTFASFSTVIAVFENLIAAAIDNFGWDRRKSSVFNLLFMLAACLPCVFGFNIWSGLHLIGARDVLESEDFIVSNLLLPIGAITYVMFCTTRWGWGFDKYLEECNAGKGVKFRRWMKPYFMYILPLLVLVIFIQGLLGN